MRFQQKFSVSLSSSNRFVQYSGRPRGVELVQLINGGEGQKPVVRVNVAGEWRKKKTRRPTQLISRPIWLLIALSGSWTFYYTRVGISCAVEKKKTTKKPKRTVRLRKNNASSTKREYGIMSRRGATRFKNIFFADLRTGKPSEESGMTNGPESFHRHNDLRFNTS